MSVHYDEGFIDQDILINPGDTYDGCNFIRCRVTVYKNPNGPQIVVTDNRFEGCLFLGDGWPDAFGCFWS